MKKKYFSKFVIFFIILLLLISFCTVVQATGFYENFEVNDEPVNASGVTISVVLFFIQIICPLISIFLIIIEAYNLIKINIKKNDGDNEEFLKKMKLKYGNRLKFVIVLFLVIMFNMGIFTMIKKSAYIIAKPIIYLYPEESQEISVKLGKEKNLTCTYPKYENEWKIFASPDGNLVDLKNGRNLYSLYWEGKSDYKNNEFENGFCVKGEDSAKFLEEKLKLLGLNDRETEEFIIYWLPRLESNKYNLIRFETAEEIEYNMPLNINPQPDTVIRVMMDFKSVNRYVEIQEQEIITPERNGFVVVEWGGSSL